MNLEPTLLTGGVVAVLIWAWLAAYVVYIDRRRTQARSVVLSVLSRLTEADVRSLPVAERIDKVTPLLERVSRDMVLHTAADGGTPQDAVDALTKYLVDRWGIYVLAREASFHRKSRDIWRRTASMKVLFHLEHPQVVEILARAIDSPSAEVASVGLTLLGMSPDPRAPNVMFCTMSAAAGVNAGDRSTFAATVVCEGSAPTALSVYAARTTTCPRPGSSAGRVGV